MTYFFDLHNWPVLAICIGMLAAAIIDWWTFKIPNTVTLPLIISGWLLGLANDVGFGAGQGGIATALIGTALGCGLLLPLFAIGGVGGGDVKMTMGFGSWMGAFYGLALGVRIIFYAFCAGAVIGGVIAMGMMIVRGNYRQNIKHVSEIIGDISGSRGIDEVADKAIARRPRWHRLPYGVPLCIGFIGYLVYVFGG